MHGAVIFLTNAIIAAQHFPYTLCPKTALELEAPVRPGPRFLPELGCPLTSATNITMPTQKQIQSQKLLALSKEVGLPVRELILSDAHLEQVAPIFYEGLPKLARMTMNREKFKAFFVKQRQQIADELFPVKA